MFNLYRATRNLMTVILSAATIVACSNNDSNDPPVVPDPAPVVEDAVFEVSVTNLTLAQPFSPIAVVLHRNGFNSFIDGETSSLALELLAEGGDNTDVLGEAVAADEHLVSTSSNGPVPPLTISDPITLRLASDQLSDVRLTVISMLIHTNDAFTGANGANVNNMEVGDTILLNGPTWDAGTEANDEQGSNMPGPDFGGEGFNTARDDAIDRVRFHQGVVTSASIESGDLSSNLVERHRFDNPTSRIRITRVE